MPLYRFLHELGEGVPYVDLTTSPIQNFVEADVNVCSGAAQFGTAEGEAKGYRPVPGAGGVLSDLEGIFDREYRPTFLCAIPKPKYTVIHVSC